MEISISKYKISQIFSPFLIPSTKNPSVTPKTTQIQGNLKNYQSMKLRRNDHGMVHCAKSDGCSLTELEAEIELDKSWGFDMEESCPGVRGMVDLMECLEKEAIMGKDEGKDANDYNRRAQIFDKSSKVFQAHNLGQCRFFVCSV